MRYLLIILLPLVFFSCTFEYELGDDIPPFKPQVVLNSIIAPHIPIEIELIWSMPYSSIQVDKKPTVDSVAVFDIKLLKDGNIILDTTGKNGLLKTNTYPEAGSVYSLEVEVLNYGKITASTNIPSSPYKLEADSVKRVMFDSPEGMSTSIDGVWYKEPHFYFYYAINSIGVSEKTRALWIKVVTTVARVFVYEGAEQEPEKVSLLSQTETEISITNPFLDQINAEKEVERMYLVAARGSVINHIDGFLRVPFKNLPRVCPINFSIFMSDLPNPIILDPSSPFFDDYFSHYVESVSIISIVPSDDYDRYQRDIYEQQAYGIRPYIPIFAETISVYSNIKGGLGIFAGYLQDVVKIKYSTPPELEIKK